MVREPFEGPVQPYEKGVPRGGTGAWNVLRDELPFPLLLLKESALATNVAAMAAWCGRNGFLLAPHGKTTMCPAIFRRQLEAGAWAITVANASQAAVCVAAGVPRILIANQLVGRANAAIVAGAMREHPELEVLCLADSVEGVRQLAALLRAEGLPRPLRVLVEWGRMGWRTGARSLPQALEVRDEVAAFPDVFQCCGVEGFEGLAHAESGTEEGRMVDEFVTGMLELAGGFGEKPIFSVGGSAFLDRVQAHCRAVADRFQVVVRSGCYVTHDHGVYNRQADKAAARGSSDVPRFVPAFELWSYVQSTPEPGTALLTFGKRDCPHDIDLPVPLFAVPAGATERVALPGARVTQLNDQHAYLNGAALQVGDRVCCGISHPCTAFDKWRVIPVVDEDYSVREWYRTYF